MADSPAGVASWRLLQQSLDQEVSAVTKAMEWLADEGYLIRIDQPGTPQMFRLNPAHVEQNKPLADDYANFLRVGYTDTQFILEFGEALEPEIDREAHTRLVTDPPCVREFVRLLSEALHSFEATHGQPGEKH